MQVIPKPAGGATKPPIMRSMSYNPAENAILINTDEEGGTYKFYRLPTGNPATITSRGEVPEAFAGQGATAVFIARNRFAVWNRFTSTIQVPRAPLPCVGVMHVMDAGACVLWCVGCQRECTRLYRGKRGPPCVSACMVTMHGREMRAQPR